MRLGRTRCGECPREAILSDAVKNKEGRFERVFVCPAGHQTIEKAEDRKEEETGKPYYERQVKTPNESEKNDPSALERLNKFLDELEGKGDA